jgi:circadian clock protein KaiB
MARDENQPADEDDLGPLTAALEKALSDESDARYVLHLYVTGMRPRSQHAIENIRRLCEDYLPGRYELKIIDIYQQPELAAGAQIIAAPTLVKSLPLPMRKLIGDMSDEGRVLVALGVKVPVKSQEAVK